MSLPADDEAALLHPAERGPDLPGFEVANGEWRIDAMLAVDFESLQVDKEGQVEGSPEVDHLGDETADLDLIGPRPQIYAHAAGLGSLRLLEAGGSQ